MDPNRQHPGGTLPLVFACQPVAPRPSGAQQKASLMRGPSQPAKATATCSRNESRTSIKKNSAGANCTGALTRLDGTARELGCQPVP